MEDIRIRKRKGGSFIEIFSGSCSDGSGKIILGRLNSEMTKELVKQYCLEKGNANMRLTEGGGGHPADNPFYDKLFK